MRLLLVHIQEHCAALFVHQSSHVYLCDTLGVGCLRVRCSQAWHFKLQTQVRMLQSELRVLLACTELLCARWPVSVTVAELITDYERGDKDTAQRLWPGPADANLRVAAATVWVLEQRISEVLKELRQPRLTEGRWGGTHTQVARHNQH